MNKVCNNCKVNKPISEFRKKDRGKYGVAGICKDCMSIKYKEYYSNNKKLKIESVKSHYKKNKQSILDKKKIYYENNRDEIISKNSIRKSEKRKKDPLFRYLCNLRRRTNHAFKNINSNKKESTKELLGCDFDIAVNHIQSQFDEKMNWDNYGEWPIDHIVPLCSAKSKSELIKLCHYTNLQPLWAEENLSKGGRY